MFPLNKKQKAGFTLIELLVVVSIISLLTSIVLSSLGTAKSKGRDTARIRAMHETRTALQMYFNDKGYYPCNIIYFTCPTRMELALKNGNYISEIHPDILYNAYYIISSNNTSHNCYNDKAPYCTHYRLGVSLENRHPILNLDKDVESTISSSIDGVSTKARCGVDTNATVNTDLCYDLASF